MQRYSIIFIISWLFQEWLLEKNTRKNRKLNCHCQKMRLCSSVQAVSCRKGGYKPRGKIFFSILKTTWGMKKVKSWMRIDLGKNMLTFQKLQGDRNHLKCLLAMILKLYISDLMLVKPKCVWFSAVFFFYNFSKKIIRLSNAFRLYQPGVRNSCFQSYC